MPDLWSNASITEPFNDPNVDLLDRSGVIDDLPSLSFDIPDNKIINNLNQRINDSKAYFDKQDGHNLTNSRNEAMRGYLGRTIDVNRLYRYQVPYNENQIYVTVESIVAYATAQNPQPECYPAQDNPTSKIFAANLEKYLMAHSDHFQLSSLLEGAVRDVLAKKVGFIELYFDPDYGENGEIIPKVLNPEHCVVDKNAAKGQLPQFFCVMTKMSVNEIIERWPDQKKAVMEELGIERRGTKNMEQEIVVRKCWVVNYDKDYKSELGVVYFFGDLVLEKIKNPNWLYSSYSKNFLPAPMIPVIPLNFDNNGEHWIDMTTPIEQALPLQNMLNKRGKQMMEVADKANGILVVSTDSGLSKDDLQNLTGDPNQRLLIKTAGQRTSDMVFQVPPPLIPPFLMQDKTDLRTQIGNIMGAPTDFTGADDGGSNGEETLGQSLLNKNQASGRQDLLVRAIDRFMTSYFNMLVQMMVVWYTEKHTRVYNGGDGEFDYVVMKRDMIDNGIAVSVKSGTTLPFDKARQEAVALNMAKMGLLSPLDIYKMLHMQNPQQLYDNWAKFKSNPQELARTANDEVDESKAYIVFKEIMNGKEAEAPDEATREFVLSLRKLMLRDEFIKGNKKYQNKFLDYVEKALNSLELRTVLDQVSSAGDDTKLDPQVPLPPYQPQPMPMPGMMPMGAPGVPPGQPPQPGGQAPLPGAPASPLAGLPTPGMQVPPQPGQMQAPLPNPMAPPQMGQQGNVSALPPM